MRVSGQSAGSDTEVLTLGWEEMPLPASSRIAAAAAALVTALPDASPVVPPEVPVPPLLDVLEAAAAAPAEACVIADLNPGGLRPSIETTMHAALPHPVVVHVHCVETIATRRP